MMIDKGAEVNARAKDGETALVYAAVMGHEDVVKLLLEKGANPNIKNKEGTTALMVRVRRLERRGQGAYKARRGSKREG